MSGPGLGAVKARAKPLALLVAAALLTPAIASAQGDREAAHEYRIVTLFGDVGRSGSDPDDWFRLRGLDAKLLIPAGEEREMHRATIDAAAEQGTSVRVRVDAGAGRLAPTGDHIVYPVCSIAPVGGDWVGDEARNCPPAAAGETETERLLARGIALTHSRPEAERPLLTRALAATPSLAPLTEALARKARADAAEALSLDLEPDDPDHDRLLAQVLSDHRRLSELLPNRPAVLSRIAEVLRDLGGYDEAHAAYREIQRRWPQESFDVALGMGALYRQQGDYRAALRVLNDYARTNPTATYGMRFHYHRAWTLMLLRSFAEAEREVTDGLLAQPDYPWALLLRSCVRAQRGRLEEALADQERALELSREALIGTNAALDPNMARSRAVIDLLRGALRQGRRGRMAAPCEGFWDRWIRPRQRSLLLTAGG